MIKLKIAVLVLFAAFCPGTANSQVLDPFRPELPLSDPAGVDTTTGYFSYQIPLFKLKERNPGWMGVFYQYNLNYGWSSSFSGHLNLAEPPLDNSDSFWRVSASFGNDLDVFSVLAGQGANYTKQQYAGRHGVIRFYSSSGVETPPPATGTSGYFIPSYIVWTDRFGRQVKYIIEYPINTYPNTGGGDYEISSIKYPNGTIYNYNYETLHTNASYQPDKFRLLSITNNWGFELKFDYQSDDPNAYSGQDRSAWLISKITQFNNAYSYCAPSAEHCAANGSWPTTTKTGNYDSGSFQGPVGEIYTYSIAQTADSGTYQFRSPTAASFNVVYNALKIGEHAVNGISYGIDYTKRVASGSVDGQNWSYSYTDAYPSGVATAKPSATKITAINPQGYSHVYDYTVFPMQVTDENGNSISYTRYGDGRIKSYTNVEGDKYIASFDDTTANRGNILSEEYDEKPSSGSGKITRTFSFPTTCSQPASCNRPDYEKDANLNEEDFAYTSFGAIASDLKPAPSPGAARPLKLYTYSQKAAYILNATGGLVSTSAPIWLLASETDCQTAVGNSTPVCDGAAPQRVVNYIYGADGTANSLLIRGRRVVSGTTSLLTCYGHDVLGNEISVTAANSAQTSCP